MTIRDSVRAKAATDAARDRELGLNIDDVRRESRSTASVAAMTTRLRNEPTQTPGHERIYAADFAGQVFNGTNTAFTLPKKVLGQNILVWRVEQSSGTLIPQERTTNPAPSAEQFWFDNFFTIRVGTAPQTLDGLLAVFISSL